MRSLFGTSEPSEEELMERRAGRNLEQQAHSQMLADDGTLSEEYVKTLVEHGLNESSARLLQNLLSKDFVLSKLEDPEIREDAWLARIEELVVLELHPQRGSRNTGRVRRFLFDDPADDLEPLTPQQKSMIRQVVMAFYKRVKRSHEGYQQEEFGKQVTVTRSEDSDSDANGGLFTR